jgi:RNA polymerase sigma-70 factor (ECF subfamily)
VIAALAALVAFRDRSRTTAEEDDALLARYDADAEAGFAAMYRGYAAAVYRRLTRILGPIAEREDLTQDVFVALHRALPRFRREARLSTLVHRIAINKAIQYLRERGRRPATVVDTWFFDGIASPVGSPEGQLATREEVERVLACLARIKPKKRIAFLLRVVDGLSFADIAELVDATPEAVAKRVQHGQRELDALLARDERAERVGASA